MLRFQPIEGSESPSPARNAQGLTPSASVPDLSVLDLLPERSISQNQLCGGEGTDTPWERRVELLRSPADSIAPGAWGPSHSTTPDDSIAPGAQAVPAPKASIAPGAWGPSHSTTPDESIAPGAHVTPAPAASIAPGASIAPAGRGLLVVRSAEGMLVRMQVAAHEVLSRMTAVGSAVPGWGFRLPVTITVR